MVAISAPGHGALVRGAVPVQVIAAGTGLGRAELFAGGNLVGSDPSPPYAFTWATPGAVADGSYTLQAKVFDSLGQVGTSQATVTVDNAPPSLWVAAPAANSTVTGTGVRIAGWATDANRVAALSLLIDGQAVSWFDTDTAVSRPDVCSAVPTGDANCPNVGWRTFFDSTRLPNGAHTLTVRATDSAGNPTLWTVPFTVAN